MINFYEIQFPENCIVKYKISRSVIMKTMEYNDGMICIL